MRTLCFALILFLSLPASIYAAAIPIVFKLNAKHDPDKVYATFYNCVGATPAPSITGTYNNAEGTGIALSTTRSYKMSELTSSSSIATGVPAGVPAVLISDFNSGRIYISYDQAMGSFGCTQPSTEPTSNDPSLGIRFQPMELDIESGSVGGVMTPIINTNLTYIDYAAIALSLTVKNATSTIANNPLMTSVSSELLTDILGKTTIENYSTVRPSASDKLPSTNFTRVLSPTSADKVRKFNDWTNYLKTTLFASTTTNNKPIKIKGFFAGVGGQPANNGGLATDREARNQTQSYDYLVKFGANGDATMTAQAGSGDGTVAGAGANTGQGVGAVNVTITFAALNASTGIYGNNPAYTYGVTTTTGVENDFYGWVVGDLLAGLSWGLAGSPVKFNATSAQNIPIGDITSAEWYGGLKSTGGAYSVPLSPVGKGYIYGKAQPGNPTNYHTYAAGLVGITGAYGFGLQDRAGATLMNFNRIAQPNGYLEIGIDTENHAVIGASPSQQSGVTVTVDEFGSKDMGASELKTTYSVEDFTTYSTVCSFNASINVNGGYGVFMINSNSLPAGSPTALRLIKLYESNGTSAFFGNYAATGPIYSDGSWWLTDLSGNHILPSDKIITGDHYYAHFVVKDNGKYDENPALGQITDPIALGTDTSGSGCVLNSEANFTFELAGLFLAALILACFRKKDDYKSLK
ncbi:hypothetical protein SAMN05660337_1583 [Maridesulfovibrio ferrireducens]|uniref:GH64 domain-containing protein n=1 Tax=Maridesulfovibrio ferrireducens TaxID=246191 RepID=A0A1G9FK93_9BACT|nr:beta-1,3-glucanase family protein [Maridesulfovibrio ferrireducens]SDK88804.1 hypothetical protein SAMN05660337_1583 [Maridesulfovibrio ferrireducens]